MNKKFKRTLVILLALVATMAFSVPAMAKTTSAPKYGGSGTMNCASEGRRVQIKEEIKGIFDASYYAALYSDLRTAYGIGNVKKLTDAQKEQLWAHFINGGIYEGRQCCKEFNVNAYFSAYGDLRKAYGDDIIAYYVHYLEVAKPGIESRPCTTVYATQKAGFNVYTVVGYQKDYQWPFNKCSWVAGSVWIDREKAYGTGECIGLGLRTWYRNKPKIDADLAELKMGFYEMTTTFYKTDVAYTSGGDGFFLKGDACYKIADGNDACYRELLDRMYALYDVWYDTAPKARDYLDTASNYIKYDDRTPDFAVLGIEYSKPLQVFYSLNTKITLAQFQGLSAADQKNYIYIGDDMFAAQVSKTNNPNAYAYLKQWKTYFANPCETYVSYWYRVPYAPIYG